MSALAQDSLLERMVYKKEAAKNITGFKRDFVKPPNMAEMGQVSTKAMATNPSDFCCFEATHYSVSEKAGKVDVTILKKCVGKL